jgi:hypothetical protein
MRNGGDICKLIVQISHRYASLEKTAILLQYPTKRGNVTRINQ